MNLYEFFIGFRYLRSKKNMGFISFNTVLSVFFVFLGVFILTVVTSVFSGFQSQIKEKILDVDAHMTVYGFDGKTFDVGISDYNEISSRIKMNDSVVSVLPFFQGQGLVRFNNKISPVVVRGMGNPGELPADFKKFVISGDVAFGGKRGLFIGEKMAENGKMKLGDTVELIVPKGDFNISVGVRPGIDKFTIAGIFKTGYYEFDSSIAVTSLPDSQKLFAVGDKVWGISVRIKDIFDSESVAYQIQRDLGYDYQVFTAEQRNQNLFYALRIQKMIMTIILFLVVLSAGFTIMGTLVMVVMEKRKAVGILKSMGAGPNSIMTVFIMEGFIIGMLGAVLGTASGAVASLNLQSILIAVQGFINALMSWIFRVFSMGTFNPVSLMPTSVYNFDKIPAEISPGFLIFIGVFTVFLSTASAVFPAWQAARLKPVETMRYE